MDSLLIIRRNRWAILIVWDKIAQSGPVAERPKGSAYIAEPCERALNSPYPALVLLTVAA